MIDIVVQGQIYDITPQVILDMLNTSFVNKVIVSTWEGQHFPLQNDRVEVLYNEDVSLPGVGNRNRQIRSTEKGLEKVSTDISAKFRSDQHFPIETLESMNEFYNLNEDGLKIFTLGLYKNWPFHPRDHMFWGPTDNLKLLFNCPHDDWPYHDDYNEILRAEAWLGCHYATHFDDSMKEFIKDHKRYLTDNAPERDKAFRVHEELYHKLFYPFPRIHYSWPKVGLSTYYYDYTASNWSEYWHEDIQA